MKQSEIKKNITNIIKDYSQEFGVPIQFVEKDYYVVRVLSEISKINYPNVKIIFSGGTCLSKAYNKIQRFSEDIDFRIHIDTQFLRSERKKFCDFIIEKLRVDKDFCIVDESIKKGNENKYLSFEIQYDKLFDNLILRPNIKVEFTFENLITESISCEIMSFIGKYIDEKPIRINCIQPIEVIANKFSALLWRVYIKDRTKPLYSRENDPTIVRHLYDISALEESLYKKEFVNLLQMSFESDRGRGGFENNYTLLEFIKIVLNKLTDDKFYKIEYTDFVESMCYSKIAEMITFEKALKTFKNLYEFIMNSVN